ncbi:membrane-associated progesterone receptor component 2-like [Aethina tumida]|uniref:membrane-associated progesterone receptor component 2-like n=1 Tax=Aethina tumida TaxID=116153 RepID=UPI0021487C06|nr:membrane-associated progesterone receptor component 2-like [Aethina tumida]
MEEELEVTCEKVSGSIFASMFSNSVPVNIALAILIMVIVYKILCHIIATRKSHRRRIKKQDFTLQELRRYDGTQKDGRILVAVDGQVFDVTAATNLYGPTGPYASFAGRDATRGLATFNSLNIKDGEYDDLDDFDINQMDDVKDWGMQFKDTYYLVGRLLKPREDPTNYTEDDY